jgi:hypothetical protein
VGWLLVLVQVPAQPSRHRVAVWRELRRAGAVPVSPGTWAVPALPVFESALARAAELAHRGGGAFTVVEAIPRDETGSGMFRDAFEAARVDEWSEFAADCGKFEAEIAREIEKEKFTLAELEEEEQSMERLRRWYRELKSRDVLRLPAADAACEHLASCSRALDDYASLVYAAVLP